MTWKTSKITIKLRRNTVIKVVFLPLLSLAIFLVLLEFGLQLSAYILKQQVERNTSVHQENARNSINILCSGDSFTFGLGASDPAYSYPAQLQNILIESLKPISLEVTNIGVPGNNSGQASRAIEAALAKQHYDYVLVLTGLNNFWNLAYNEFSAASSETPLKKKLNTWLEKSRVIRLFSILKIRLAARFHLSGNDLGTCWSYLNGAYSFEEARDCFTSYLRFHPNNLWGRVGLGMAYYWAEQYEAGLPHLEWALNKDTTIPDLYLFSGLCYFRTGDLDKARLRFRQLSHFDIAQNLSHILLGWTYLKNDNFEEAQSEFDRISPIGSYVSLASSGRGYILFRQGLYQEAREQFQIAVKGENWYSAWLGICFTYLAEDAVDQLTQWMETIPEYYRQRFEILTLKAWMMLFRHEVVQARSLFEFIHRIKPTYSPALYGLSMCDKIETTDTPFIFSKLKDQWFFTPYPDDTHASFWLHNEHRHYALAALEYDLDRIKFTCEQNGATLLLLTYPHVIGQEALQNVIKTYTQTHSIPLIDLSTLFADRVTASNYSEYFVQDLHPNDKGYSVIADRVYKELYERILLDSSKKPEQK